MKRKISLILLSSLLISSCSRNINTTNPISYSYSDSINSNSVNEYSDNSFNYSDTTDFNNINVETNKTKLLVDGNEIFPEIYNILDMAKEKIYISTYLFGGKVGREISQRLIEKKKQGVQIKFVAEKSMGYLPDLVNAAKTEFDYLNSNGVEVKYFPVDLLPKGPTFISNQKLINHSKMVLVDDKYAVIGGMNFKDSEAINHDYMFRIEGPAVKNLSVIGDDNWEKSKTFQIKSFTGSNIEVAQTGFREQSIKNMLLNHFNSAKTSIFVQMLLLDHHEIVQALINAQSRGVDVRIILDQVEPGKYNKFIEKLPLEGMSNFGAVVELLDAKVPVKWYVPKQKDEMLHAKISMIDNKTIITGSANFTYHALTRNHEVNVSVNDFEAAERFKQIFEKDWNNNTKEINLSFWQKITGKLFKKALKYIYNKNENEIMSLVR